jgi:hypothetical protein
VLDLFSDVVDGDSAGLADATSGSGTIDFETFALTAALANRIVALDPYVRNCLNKTDYTALVKKKRTAIGLFKLDANVQCELSLDHLAIILDSGRVVNVEKQEVIRRLSHDSSGNFITFLTYLAYLPLFLDIHDDIIGNTFRQARRSLVESDIDLDELDAATLTMTEPNSSLLDDETHCTAANRYDAL